jgi:pimeloyl-ACP methyl ester carboxylesterase
MGFLDWLASRATSVVEEVQDAGRAALYVRQLVRGNRRASQGAPSAMRADGRRTRAAARSLRPDGAQPQARLPVLLVHGFFATRGSLHLLEERLGARGHLLLSYRLGGLHLAAIRRSAALIGRKIAALCAQTGVERVDLVGHSMGGLVGLYYVKHLGGHRRVRRLVLLGSPVNGTWTAMAGLVAAPLGAGGLDLLPRSAALADLRSGELPPGVEVVTVAGSRDFFAPPEVTEIPGVERVILPTTHAGLLVDPQVADVLGDLLERPEPAARAGEDQEDQEDQGDPTCRSPRRATV